VTKYLNLILKNLFRNRRRTVLTILSIAVSIFIFSALASVPTAVNQVLSNVASSRRLVVHNRAGLPYGLPPAYLPKILALPHVEAAVAQSWYGGIYHEVTDEFPNWTLDTDGVEKVFSDWGVSEQGWRDFKSERRACLVGAETMKRFHFKIGQQLMLRPSIPDYPEVQLQIVGILGHKAPPDILVFRRDYLQEALKASTGQVPFTDSMWVMPDSHATTSQVAKEIDESFANSSAETQTETEKSFFASFLSNYRLIFDMAEWLGLIVVVTIGLVAANTASMSIRERRGEIALMRSLGFSSSGILWMLLGESAAIAILGGVIGCIGALLVLNGARLGGLGPLSTIRMPPLVLAEAMVIAIGIGFLSAWVPARSAARRNIVDTLRAI
jgi:putative ABC transport system permease protein